MVNENSVTKLDHWQFLQEMEKAHLCLNNVGNIGSMEDDFKEFPYVAELGVSVLPYLYFLT